MLQPKWVLQLLTRQDINELTNIPNPNDDDDNQNFHYLFEGYEEYLGTQISSARDDFNTSINWVITSLGIILSILLTSNTFPNISSWFVLLVVIIVCTHFATRLARAYLNLLRWSVILQRITRLRLGLTTHNQDTPVDTEKLLKGIYEAIDQYHIKWISPISTSKLILAIFFEFGFGYFFAIIIALMVYTYVSIEYSHAILISFLLCLLIVLWEWRVLLRGPYLRQVYIPSDMPWKKLI